MHTALARRAHQEAATLLTAVEHHAPRLARTYCQQILHSLLPLLKTDAPLHTAAAVTYSLAELLTISGRQLDPYANDLLALPSHHPLAPSLLTCPSWHVAGTPTTYSPSALQR